MKATQQTLVIKKIQMPKSSMTCRNPSNCH